MNKTRFLKLIFALCALAVCLCSCKTAEIENPDYNLPKDLSADADFKVAENDTYILEYMSEYASVALKDKTGNIVWSTTTVKANEPRLDEYGDPIPLHSQVKSPIAIEYIEPTTSKISLSYAYGDCIRDGNFTVKQIDNGVEVTYFFDEVGISVPVRYVLKEKGVEVSVNTAEICENENRFYSVSIAPYACGIPNLSDSGYLFVPSGSGAIIEPCQLEDGFYSYSRELYGNDAERALEQGLDTDKFPENRMAVIGAKLDNNSALCGIITDGAEHAFIEANVGAANIGFSNVSVKFAARAYQWSKIRSNQQVKLYSEDMAQTKFAVTFTPLLNEENANYVAMADCYREYLKDNYRMNSKMDSSALTLKIIGGANVTKNILGFSYDKFYTATTLDDAKKIIEDVSERTGVKPNINLLGFGKDGLDIKTVAGGYTVNGQLGGKKGLKNIAEYSEQKGINLFMNFDVISASKSGGGISKLFDMALSQDKSKIKQYYYNIYSRLKTTRHNSYLLIGREDISGVCNRLVKETEKMNLKGISLDTLSSVCYSDYSSVKYFSKGNTAEDVSEILKNFAKKDYNLAVTEANDFAAAESDIVIDTPLTSSKNNIFSYDIPFYSIVFKGYTNLASESLNLMANADEMLLSAAEVGCGISYTVVERCSTELFDSFSSAFYGSVYDGLADGITETVKSYKETFESVKNAKITNHSVLDNGLRKTVFDNGVTVYVNYTDNEISADGVSVSPNSYISVKG